MIPRGCVLLLWLGAGAAPGEPLPGGYYKLLEAGIQKIEAKLNAEPGADLKTIESGPVWRHFPHAVLPPAVLFKRNTGNRRLLDLAIKVGDLAAAEDEQGRYESRLDSHRDTYMWLEAYRLLEPQLGAERRARWRRCLEGKVATLQRMSAPLVDFPWYNSPYIGTSPNHFSLWASTMFLAGKVFGNREWVELGARILHRFAALEQTPDGYWGEHSRSGPTTGYNHLTLTAVGLYQEHSRDPEALEALRRATAFHSHYTYPDGHPVETINDRNRYWELNPWGHFAFSHFPEGRGYAEFLTRLQNPEWMSVETLGRLAQNALYYHAGPTSPAPPERPRYSHQMSVPAGIRKTGPWVVCLSGLIATQTPFSQWYLDRQGHLSVFHHKTGLIVTGANSKRQPELATFLERIKGQVFHLPLSSRLQMTDSQDRLSMAYNQFFVDIETSPPSTEETEFRVWITGKGPAPEQALLNLQLCLKAGEELETGTGRRIKLSAEPLEISAQELGGLVRHHGWTLKTDPAARLVWPVYPFNPYRNGPETRVEQAVGALSVPLRLNPQPGRYIRSREQEIRVTLSVR